MDKQRGKSKGKERQKPCVPAHVCVKVKRKTLTTTRNRKKQFFQCIFGTHQKQGQGCRHADMHACRLAGILSLAGNQLYIITYSSTCFMYSDFQRFVPTHTLPRYPTLLLAVMTNSSKNKPRLPHNTTRRATTLISTYCTAHTHTLRRQMQVLNK